MHPYIAEIIADLHNKILTGHLTDLAASYRKAVGALGVKTFRSQVGYARTYQKIIKRSPQLFLEFTKVTKPEYRYTDKENNNLFHLYLKEPNPEIIQVLIDCDATFCSENLKGEDPWDVFFANLKDTPNHRKVFDALMNRLKISSALERNEKAWAKFKDSFLFADYKPPESKKKDDLVI